MHRRELIVGIAALVPSLVLAKNYDEEAAKENEVVAEWFKSVQFPNGATYTSCCGVGDAYWADDVEYPKGVDYFFATITDDRAIKNRSDWNGVKLKIPNEKIDHLRQGNPTGHNVVFVAPKGGEDSSIDNMVRKVADVAGKDYYDIYDVNIYCFFPNAGI
jgi:hypothetical protein